MEICWLAFFEFLYCHQAINFERVDQDVLVLEVSVHDSLRVETLQGFHQLDENDSDCPFRELPPPVGCLDE
jgi:hypothetical protein